MAQQRTPYQQLRQIEFMINGLRPEMDADRVVHKAFESLQKKVQVAQQTLKDYEMAESEEDTRAQLRILPRAVKSLEQLREAVLHASQYDLIGPVDVAQQSAEIDELIDRLK